MGSGWLAIEAGIRLCCFLRSRAVCESLNMAERGGTSRLRSFKLRKKYARLFTTKVNPPVRSEELSYPRLVGAGRPNRLETHISSRRHPSSNSLRIYSSSPSSRRIFAESLAKYWSFAVQVLALERSTTLSLANFSTSTDSASNDLCRQL
jgi:hypothetical protein